MGGVWVGYCFLAHLCCGLEGNCQAFIAPLGERWTPGVMEDRNTLEPPRSHPLLVFFNILTSLSDQGGATPRGLSLPPPSPATPNTGAQEDGGTPPISRLHRRARGQYVCKWASAVEVCTHHLLVPPTPPPPPPPSHYMI